MTTQEFIEKAIEGGWNPFIGRATYAAKHDGVKVYLNNADDGRDFISMEKIILDPEAWKAVGKVEGWGGSLWVGEMRELKGESIITDKWECFQWEYRMMKMIGALAEGKTIEQYLETL